MYNLIFVGIGGAVGSMARYLLSSVALSGYNILGFPAGTFTVNVAGSFLIGMFMSLFTQGTAAQVLFVTGLCGGFTTFSTFSADTIKLIRMARWDSAALYILMSVFIALICTAAGLWLGTEIKRIFS